MYFDCIRKRKQWPPKWLHNIGDVAVENAEPSAIFTRRGITSYTGCSSALCPLKWPWSTANSCSPLLTAARTGVSGEKRLPISQEPFTVQSCWLAPFSCWVPICLRHVSQKHCHLAWLPSQTFLTLALWCFNMTLISEGYHCTQTKDVSRCNWINRQPIRARKQLTHQQHHSWLVYEESSQRALLCTFVVSNPPHIR
jgi:hypothetical protein